MECFLRNPPCAGLWTFAGPVCHRLNELCLVIVVNGELCVCGEEKENNGDVDVLVVLLLYSYYMWVLTC